MRTSLKSSRIVPFSLLFTIAMLVVVTVTSVFSQTAFRRNGKIAFTSDRDGNREIYVMNRDGTDQVRLTSNTIVDDHPTWSPDGRKIAFVSQRPTGAFAIFVMAADGSNKFEVTPVNDIHFNQPIWDFWGMSWSPDGDQIAFQDQFNVLLVNVDGSNRHLLTSGTQPSWSPDGSKILFSNQVSKFYRHLFTIKPDGTDLHALASFAGDTDNAPTWSPTGDKIAFELFDYANFENIAIVNADGTGRFWFDNGGLGPAWGGRDKPDWSPNGHKIVFHVSLGEGNTWDTEIFVKNINGSAEANGSQITNTPGNNFKPSWQPISSGPFDFDGDGRADLSVRRPSDNIWYLLRGVDGYTAMEFGIPGDSMVPADYDGDGRTDVAMYRPSQGRWYIHMSESQTFKVFNWGHSADVPVPSDRDADGRTDLVIFRPSDNTWYTRFANDTFDTFKFGEAGDRPVVGDFDADGEGDIALFRPSNSNWYIIKSSLGFFIQTWGQPGDRPFTGDFDGDGATDHAVFRPSTGQWFLSRTTQGFAVQNWGEAGDIPIPADYDGDGKTDVAIFRPSSSKWYIVNSTAGIQVQQFGESGDVPTQSAFNY